MKVNIKFSTWNCIQIRKECEEWKKENRQKHRLKFATAIKMKIEKIVRKEMFLTFDIVVVIQESSIY